MPVTTEKTRRANRAKKDFQIVKVLFMLWFLSLLALFSVAVSVATQAFYDYAHLGVGTTTGLTCFIWFAGYSLLWISCAEKHRPTWREHLISAAHFILVVLVATNSTVGVVVMSSIFMPLCALAVVRHHRRIDDIYCEKCPLVLRYSASPKHVYSLENISDEAAVLNGADLGTFSCSHMCELKSMVVKYAQERGLQADFFEVTSDTYIAPHSKLDLIQGFAGGKDLPLSLKTSLVDKVVITAVYATF
jgi:hypothetical protein